jgi:hypothetical protein
MAEDGEAGTGEAQVVSFAWTLPGMIAVPPASFAALLFCFLAPLPTESACPSSPTSN